MKIQSSVGLFFFLCVCLQSWSMKFWCGGRQRSGSTRPAERRLLSSVFSCRRFSTWRAFCARSFGPSRGTPRLCWCFNWFGFQTGWILSDKKVWIFFTQQLHSDEFLNLKHLDLGCSRNHQQDQSKARFCLINNCQTPVLIFLVKHML